VEVTNERFGAVASLQIRELFPDYDVLATFWKNVETRVAEADKH
jgi:hypothetical protein